jgi:alpha/beta superfamily hydrolase
MRLRYVLITLCLFALAACSSQAATVAHTPTPAPTETPPLGTFNFTTEDNVTLNGQIIGQGRTAIIFSNGKQIPKIDWQPVALQLAGRGYLALLYDYRGIPPSGGRNDPDLRDRDLRAAVEVARARGATSLVLVGSSFGGTLTTAIAAQAHPTAIVVLSAPLSDGAISVSDDALRALAAPKLFMVSQDDTRYVGPVQQMYAMSPQPKQIYIYPGKNHGDAILTLADTGDAAMQRLISFLQAYAPAS